MRAAISAGYSKGFHTILDANVVTAITALVLFARDGLTFPDDGPWLAALRSADPVGELPAFADIPFAGTRIEAGRPILTLFARADALAACLDVLQQTAADLDHWLFGR